MAALLSGSGPVALAATEEATSLAAREAGRLLGREDSLEIIHSPLAALIKEKAGAWQDKFGLIILSASPYAMARPLRHLISWLDQNQGRLIAAGLTSDPQTTLILRNSFKAGFFLHSSAVSGGFSVLNLTRKPPRPDPIWDWSPGAWLTELTEDEKSILAEAEAADRTKSPAPEAWLEE
jgi:hypothetical protein